MFSAIVKKFDYITLFFSIAGAVALFLNANYVLAIFMALAIILLIINKNKYDKYTVFCTYFFNIAFFGILFYETSEMVIFSEVEIPDHILIPIGVAILFGVIAVFSNLGSYTLSVLWLTLQLLMTYVSFRMADGNSIFSTFWSTEAQQETLHTFYPILMAAMLIGVFLEKYQYEIQRDKLIR